MITLDELTRGRRARTVTLGDDWQRSTGGLYVPLDALPLARKVRRYGTRPIAIDLFSGVGGMSLGLKEAGWNVIACFEAWDDAALTYMANLCRYGQVALHYATPDDAERFEQACRRRLKLDDTGELVEGKLAGSGWIAGQPDDVPGTAHVFFGDVRAWTGPQILELLGLERGDIDLVAGGPPCQGFSTAGRRNVMDPRNSLVFEFARLVLDLYPKTMVMENVPGMLSMTTPEGENVVEALCRILEEGSFGQREQLRDALLATAGLETGAARRSARASQADAAPERKGSGKPKAEPVARQAALL